MQVTTLESVAQLAATPEAIDRDRPDAHVVVTEGGRLTARCSCWWTAGPGLTTGAVGAIGHYAARDEPSGREALRRACAVLAAAGCAMAIGPMDGNTWRPYRFITDRGPEPAFFLEPDNPDEWPRYFATAGFSPMTTYLSAVTSDLARASAGAADAEVRLQDLGITLRPLDMDRVDRELRGLYTVSLAAFRDNPWYAPITEEDFRGRYRAVLPFVRPELVTIAEFDRQAIGFLCAIPDAMEARRTHGAAVQTIILKSLAVLPQWRGIGLGGVLFGRTHGIAREFGYTRAIHALMHDANASRVMSGRSARPFRRYTLFGRSL